jgi:HPt (histidine-containing phosphotransfer) domain-containing protein
VLASALNRYARRAHEMPASHASGANQRHDVPQVDLLEADIGSELTLDLMREYLAGAEQAVESLERDPLDGPTVHSDAHRLLGGARILGLGTLEHLWQTLSDESARPAVPAATIAELRRACTELRAWMNANEGAQLA